MDVVVVESNLLGRAHACAAIGGVIGLVLRAETDSLAGLESFPVVDEALLLVGLGHLGDPSESVPRLKAAGFTVVGMWPERSGALVDQAVQAGVLGVLHQPLTAPGLARLLLAAVTDPTLPAEAVGRAPIGSGARPGRCD